MPILHIDGPVQEIVIADLQPFDDGAVAGADGVFPFFLREMVHCFDGAQVEVVGVEGFAGGHEEAQFEAGWGGGAFDA